MHPDVLHLHTNFLFPVFFDRDAVMDEHPELWQGSLHWFEKLDQWVEGHVLPEYQQTTSQLGTWRRHSETSFDLKSPTYQDMMFFHSFVRRAFFDTGDANPEHEALVHRYVLHPGEGARLFYEADSEEGRVYRAEVTDLRLLMFANGVGILNLGIEARGLPFADALWINEMMRKVYPSSAHQIETGRIPVRCALVQEIGGTRHVVAEERWTDGRGLHYRPQLSALVLSLFHFANYFRGEFEAVLDERMIVRSFVCLDHSKAPAGYEMSAEYEAAFSRLLYVDRDGPGFRYELGFTRADMARQVYRRWQHLGTLYGMTSYSSVTCTLALPDTVDSTDGTVYRMFRTRHLLLAVIGLFYRASLLGFAGESALVSRLLFPVFSGGSVRHRHIQFATRLMADFHYFNTYWFHMEPTTKDEELEHFRLLSTAYGLNSMKTELENQIASLAGFIDRLFVLRNNDAVNRLAMMSVLLGIGALVTGYFGMNIPNLEDLMKNPTLSFWTLMLTSIMMVASLWFVGYIIASNWMDYRSSIFPHRYRRPLTPKALRELRHPEREE